VHQELFKNGVRTLIGATLKNLVKNLIGEFFLYDVGVRGDTFDFDFAGRYFLFLFMDTKYLTTYNLKE
jgi:hypothetical protein